MEVNLEITKIKKHESNFYFDEEVEEIKKSKEKPLYYRVYGYHNDIQIKCYKPSMAKLMSKRTGKRMEVIG